MVANLSPNPLSTLRITSKLIPGHGHIPNTSILQKPLLHYHAAFSSKSTTASGLESHLKSVGAVVPQWRYTMYSTSHFHSTSHEVLAVASGRARCLFGGEGNEGAYEGVLERGDVVVLPAGVAHRLVEDLDGGFQMVGCYPPGCQWDMCYGRKDEADKVEGIKGLKWFTQDPVYGGEGPTLDV